MAACASAWVAPTTMMVFVWIAPRSTRRDSLRMPFWLRAHRWRHGVGIRHEGAFVGEAVEDHDHVALFAAAAGLYWFGIVTVSGKLFKADRAYLIGLARVV